MHETNHSTNGSNVSSLCQNENGGDNVVHVILTSLGALAVLFCLVGIPGNLFTVWYFKKKETKTTVTSFLLMALGLLDAITLIGLLPRTIINIWIYGVDRISGFKALAMEDVFRSNVAVLPMYMSNFVILLISVERMISLVQPHSPSLLHKKVFLNVCLIVLAAILTAMCVFISQETKLKVIDVTCNEPSIQREFTQFGQRLQILYQCLHIAFFIFTFCLPVVIVGVSNIITIVMLVRRHRMKFARTRTVTAHHIEMKITKIVLVVTIVFLVSIAPIGFVEPLNKIWKANIIWDNSWKIHAISTYMEVFSFSANSFIYCVGSSAYRKDLKQALLRPRQLLTSAFRKNRIGVTDLESRSLRITTISEKIDEAKI